MEKIAGGSALIDSLFQPQDWGLTNDEILAQAAGAATLKLPQGTSSNICSRFSNICSISGT